MGDAPHIHQPGQHCMRGGQQQPLLMLTSAQSRMMQVPSRMFCQRGLPCQQLRQRNRRHQRCRAGVLGFMIVSVPAQR